MLTFRTPYFHDLPTDPAEDPIQLGLQRTRISVFKDGASAIVDLQDDPQSPSGNEILLLLDFAVIARPRASLRVKQFRDPQVNFGIVASEDDSA